MTNYPIFDMVSVTRIILPRDAMLARYMLSSCVCLSVCLSVTRRYCTKTAKHRITQKIRWSRDSSFLVPKNSAKFQRGHSKQWRQIEVG